jgi:putative transposase
MRRSASGCGNWL